MTPTPRHGALQAASHAFALSLVAAAGVIARKLELAVDLSDPAPVFLTAVLLSAVAGGLGPSLVASVAGFFAYNYFFVDPRYGFTVATAQGVVSLLVFLFVAALTSYLLARAREQAELARRHAERTSALYAFSRDLAAAGAIDDLLRIIVAHVGTLFDTRAVILVPDRDRLVCRAAYPDAAAELPERERDRISWAWAHAGAEDAASSMTPGQQWLQVSLGTARGQAAVLCLELPDARRRLDDDQLSMLDALSRQAALAIERCGIDVVLAEKAKTEQVIEASEDGIFVLDGDGRVVNANAVACAIVGLEREHVVGRSFGDLESRQPQYLRLREVVGNLRKSPEHGGERSEITASIRGRNHHYLLRHAPYATPGEPAGLILALQDVTYVRDQEAQRENLVATLAHELRTPLTSLRMAMELLRQRRAALTSDSQELIETVHEDVLRLQDVSERFLDLARSRATTVGLQRRRFELHDLLARTLRPFSIQAKDKDVALEVSEQVLEPVLGDETKLGWALSNLLANAIRYTPPGGTVRLEASSRDGAVLVSVSDTGPGIAPDEQERVFERYAQGAGADGAAGLGLAIVREIVQAHGGRVHLSSARGTGTRFTLELPSE